MEEIHNNQPNEVLPYQYEPEVTGNASSGAESSDSESEGDLSHLVFTRKYKRDLRHQMVYIFISNTPRRTKSK